MKQRRIPKNIGTKREVYFGKATKTSGGLRKNDLVWNDKKTKIVSKKQKAHGKKWAHKLLPYRRDRAGMAELRKLRGKNKTM